MIELLYKKKSVREFLNKYSTKLWNVVIPYVVEIGVLNLRNSFGTLYFTNEDFQNILDDLKNKIVNTNLVPDKAENQRQLLNTQIKHEHAKPNAKEELEDERKRNRDDFAINKLIRSRSNSAEKFIARKASKEWRDGDKEMYDHDGVISQMRKIYSTSRENSKSKCKKNIKELEVQDETNSQIYPQWWGSVPYDPEFKKGKEYRPAKTEIFINSDDEKKNSSERKCHSKKRLHSHSDCEMKMNKRSKYQQKVMKQRAKMLNANYDHNEFQDKLKYAESKIRAEVLHDKKIHEVMNRNIKKHKNPLHESSEKEWKYRDYIHGKNEEEAIEEVKVQAPRYEKEETGINRNNRNTNYMISYDRNFRPEMVKQKSKAKEEKCKSHNRNFRPGYPRTREGYQYNKQVKNLDYKDKEPDKRIELEEADMSFKKRNVRKNEEDENENEGEGELSSCSISERTKDAFQKEMKEWDLQEARSHVNNDTRFHGNLEDQENYRNKPQVTSNIKLFYQNRGNQGH